MNFNSDIFINLPTCSFPSNGCLRAKADELIMLHKPGEMRTIQRPPLWHRFIQSGTWEGKLLWGRSLLCFWGKTDSLAIHMLYQLWQSQTERKVHCVHIVPSTQKKKNPFRINNGAKWNKHTVSPFSYLPRKHRCSGTVITTAQLQSRTLLSVPLWSQEAAARKVLFQTQFQNIP